MFFAYFSRKTYLSGAFLFQGNKSYKTRLKASILIDFLVFLVKEQSLDLPYVGPGPESSQNAPQETHSEAFSAQSRKVAKMSPRRPILRHFRPGPESSQNGSQEACSEVFSAQARKAAKMAPNEPPGSILAAFWARGLLRFPRQPGVRIP